MLSYVFQGQCEGVRFEDLVSGDEESIFHNVLQCSTTSRATRVPAMRIVRTVSEWARRGSTATPAFTSAVLMQLQELIGLLEPSEAEACQELLLTLSG